MRLAGELMDLLSPLSAEVAEGKLHDAVRHFQEQSLNLKKVRAGLGHTRREFQQVEKMIITIMKTVQSENSVAAL